MFGDGFAILPNSIYRDGGYEDPEAEAHLQRSYVQAVALARLRVEQDLVRGQRVAC